jgi:23S rRNA pseudouridine1911/1915/1917 synthase
MILAKTAAAMQHYKQQFKKHYAKKEYLALVFGELNGNDGRINQAIIRSRRNPSRRTIVPKTKAHILSGKMAITEWRIEKALTKNYTLLRVYPLTGRTHQIRVHLHFIGHPIVGDHLYTFKRQQSPPGVKRQMLHAEKLTIKLPAGVRKSYRAPLPEDFVTVLQGLHYDISQLNTDTKPTTFRTPSSFKSRSVRTS